MSDQPQKSSDREKQPEAPALLRPPFQMLGGADGVNCTDEGCELPATDANDPVERDGAVRPRAD